MYKEYKLFIDSNRDDIFDISTDDYSKNLQLPFSINEKADETYDTASLILNRTTRKEPFPPNTKVQIEIYKRADVLINDNEPYSMMVEEDKVSKYYLGNRVFYKHELTLIERTKLLDNILLPSFIVTQPKDAVIIRSADIEDSAEITDYKCDDLTDYYLSNTRLHQTEIFRHYHNTSSNSLERLSCSAYLYTPEFTDYNIQINKTYLVNTRVPLPAPKSIISKTSSLFFELTWSNHNGNNTGSYSTALQDIPRVFEVYLRKDGGSNIYKGYITYLTDGSINKVYSSSSDDLTADGLKLPEINSSYTITLKEVFPSNDNFRSFISGFSSLTGYSNYYNWFIGSSVYDVLKKCLSVNGGAFSNSKLLKHFPTLYAQASAAMSDSDIDSVDSDAILQIVQLFIMATESDFKGETGLEPTSGIYAFDKFKSKSKTYGPSITASVNTHEATVDIEKNVYGYNGTKTIGDLMDKVLALIDENAGTFTIESSSEMDQLLTFPVPEKAYGSKAVSEILFELGKLINAYPYLTNENKIKFKRVIPRDNPLFNDSTEGENVIYNTEDNISTYVTDVEYMVGETEGIKSYWPDRTNFQYPNGDFSSSTINADNAGIKIQNSAGINELIYIKVTNCLENYGVGSSSTVIDITDYCLEKKVYDACYTYSAPLSISNRSKNNTFFWTKGENFISFGALTSQMAVSIFGADAPEEYAIQRAIKHSAKLQLKSSNFKLKVISDIVKFKFQVCYIDQISGRIKTEKFSSEAGKKTVMSNNNQTENKISSIDWADVSQTDILRRGNLDLTKTVLIRDLNKLPILGEFKRDNNSLYFADDIVYLFNNNIVTATVNFTKDYSKINGNVAIYKDYRQYEIYTSDIVNRSVNIDRYFYLSLDNPMSGAINSPINYTSQFLNSSNICTRMKTPMYALVFFHRNEDGDPLRYNNVDYSGTIIGEPVTNPGILLPLSYSASGNTIILKSEMYDNYSAAYYSNLNEEDALTYYDYWGHAKTSSARPLKEVRYVDNFGEAAYYSIYLIKPGYESNVFNPNTFPGVFKDFLTEEDILDEWVLDKELNKPLFKDNRERLTFVYQFHFLTNDNRIKWHPSLCKYLFYDDSAQNELYIDNHGSMITDNKTSIYASSDSIKDFNYVYDTNFTKIGTVNINESSDSIDSISYTPTKTFNGYCIAYPKTQEILFHINKEMRPGVSYTLPPIYFNYFNKKQ